MDSNKQLEEDSIILLNKDVEQFVIQSALPRTQIYFKDYFKDKFKPISFVHSADMHNVLSVWNRMVEYVNYYKDYISFILHTGDYCGGSQKLYTDFYKDGLKCVHPIYNCVGNHDCYDGNGKWELAPKKTTYDLLFNDISGWDVNFHNVENSMSYYKDFPESNLRLIVLDDYYDVKDARVWLKSILDDAKLKGLHVITAQHELTGDVTNTMGVKFNTLDDYVGYVKSNTPQTENLFDYAYRQLFEDVIAEFISQGGKFICNLAGHAHVDYFGYTNKGVLNVCVPNGTNWDLISDTKRVDGTKTMDCFNVVAIDTDIGLLKIIRVGANVDHYMRKKTAICYDYINKKVISEI